MSRFALTATRGDTIPLLVTVSGAGVDVATADFFFTAKRSTRDADDAALVRKTLVAGASDGIAILDADGGQILVTVEPADTDVLTRATTLYCDVQMVEDDGRVTTVAGGTLAVVLDVTRATS